MRLIAKAIRISHAKFHCNRLTTLQDIQDYASLIFATYIVYTVQNVPSDKAAAASTPLGYNIIVRIRISRVLRKVKNLS